MANPFPNYTWSTPTEALFLTQSCWAARIAFCWGEGFVCFGFVLLFCFAFAVPAPRVQLMPGQLQNPVDNIADDVNVWSFDTLRPDGVARAACLAPTPLAWGIHLVPQSKLVDLGVSAIYHTAFRPLGPKFRSHGRCDALPLGDWLAFSGRHFWQLPCNLSIRSR